MTSVEEIRISSRDERERSRKGNRFAANCDRRALGEVSDSFCCYKLKEIEEVAHKLKHKHKVSLLEMKKLKNSFIVSQENIAAFLNVPGALAGLVRELSGNDSEFQFLALNCCCNLALGNEKLCYQLTKASASYIASSMDDLNEKRMDICLWTFGNMAGSGMKSWTLLRSHGVLNKYLHLLTSHNPDVCQSAIYATTMYVKTGFASITGNEFRMIADHVSSVLRSGPSVCWLLFLLSCSPEARQVLVMNVVGSLVVDMLVNLVNSRVDLQVCLTDVTALVRVLANLCHGEGTQGNSGIELSSQSADFLSAVSKLLAAPYRHVQKETLWLLANLIKHDQQNRYTFRSLEPRIQDILA